MISLFVTLFVVWLVKETVSTNEVWFPVFVAFEGNGKSVYDAWQSQSECNPLPTSFGTAGSQRHLRNSVVDNWNKANIRMVKVKFFQNNQIVAWMTFNGRNTDKMNWFSKSNLVQSSFNDLGPCSTFNKFSIAGACSCYSDFVKRHQCLSKKINEPGFCQRTSRPFSQKVHRDHQRKFYVNQNYGGCANDQGWMYVLDQNRGCPYERIGSIPLFLYTKNFTDRNWTRTMAQPADMMVISVLAGL